MAEPKDFYVHIDMNGLQIKNHRLHILSSDPASPNDGDIWYNQIDYGAKITTTRGVTAANRNVVNDDDDFANRLNTVTTIENADMIMIWDDSASSLDHQDQYRQISVQNFLANAGTIQNSYYKFNVDAGDIALTASGAEEFSFLGDGSIIQTVGQDLATNKLNLSFISQNANLILAGPATGAAATPTFRSLTDDDMPSSYDPVLWDAMSAHASIVSGNPHNVLATEITDFDTEVSNNVDVTANTAHVAIINGNPHGVDVNDLDLSAYALLAGRNGDILLIDTINEFNTGHGVIIEGVLIKDGVISGGSISIVYDASGRNSATDAGTIGDMVFDDDYLYMCTTTGAAQSAVWKKIPMLQT